MRRITEAQYAALPDGYKGHYLDYQGIHPECKGARTAILYSNTGTALYIEGLSLEIVQEGRPYHERHHNPDFRHHRPG